MIRRTIPVLLLLIFLAQLGIDETLSRPEYLTNLTAVYGSGSCATCHVNPSGGGALTLYGQLFSNQSNYSTDPSAALVAAGAPPGMTATPNVTMTAAATAGATMTAAPVVTETVTVIETAVVTPAATRTPGFGLVVSVAGLLACFVLLRRRN